MKSAIQIFCVVLLGLEMAQTGHAFVFDAFNFKDFIVNKISACRMSHQSKLPFPHSTCYDQQKVLDCLNKITITASTMNYKHFLELRRNESVSELEQCPGFAHEKDVCRKSIIHDCKFKFEKRKLEGDITVCKDVQTVRDCLWSKMSPFCTKDTIDAQTADIDELEEVCNNGSFHLDPCSKYSVKECTKDVIHNFCNSKGLCEPKLLARADACLEEKEKKCLGYTHLDNIKTTKVNLKKFCSSAVGLDVGSLL